MRARRREINIFNMSLLDILCGALGAFCFMMLVALPYYKPAGTAPDLRKAQAETEKLMRDLEQMKTQMRDQKSVAEMEELMRRLEAQVKALQGQVNILSAEKEELQRRADQLTTEKDRLAQENQELKARLAAKKPFTIVLRADDLGQGLDVMLFKPSALEKTPNPLFQSWVDGRYNDMHTVHNALLFGRGLGIFVGEDSRPNTEGQLFVRLTNPVDHRKTATIEGAIVGDEMRTMPIRLPRATLYAERNWVLLGTVLIDQNSQFRFQEATTAEREAAWQSLVGSTPPPTPTPAPTASDAERAAAQAERTRQQAVYKKFTVLMRTPPDDDGKNDAEILRLSDELLRELPPNSPLRREVEVRREQALDLKARRNKHAAPTASP